MTEAHHQIPEFGTSPDSAKTSQSPVKETLDEGSRSGAQSLGNTLDNRTTSVVDNLSYPLTPRPPAPIRQPAIAIRPDREISQAVDAVVIKALSTQGAELEGDTEQAALSTAEPAVVEPAQPGRVEIPEGEIGLVHSEQETSSGAAPARLEDAGDPAEQEVIFDREERGQVQPVGEAQRPQGKMQEEIELEAIQGVAISAQRDPAQDLSRELIVMDEVGKVIQPRSRDESKNSDFIEAETQGTTRGDMNDADILHAAPGERSAIVTLGGHPVDMGISHDVEGDELQLRVSPVLAKLDATRGTTLSSSESERELQRDKSDYPNPFPLRKILPYLSLMIKEMKTENRLNKLRKTQPIPGIILGTNIEFIELTVELAGIRTRMLALIRDTQTKENDIPVDMGAPRTEALEPQLQVERQEIQPDESQPSITWNNPSYISLQEQEAEILAKWKALQKEHPMQNLFGTNKEIRGLNKQLKSVRKRLRQYEEASEEDLIPDVALQMQLDELGRRDLWAWRKRHKSERAITRERAIAASEAENAEPIIPHDAIIISDNNTAALEEQMIGLFLEHIPPLQTFNFRVVKGEVIVDDGYVKQDKGFLLRRLGRNTVIGGHNSRGEMQLYPLFRVHHTSPKDVDLKVVFYSENIIDCLTPELELRTSPGKDTKLQLHWSSQQNASQTVQIAFADHPELIDMVKLTQVLGGIGIGAGPENEIKLVVSEAQPRSKEHPQGVPYSVSLVLSQEDPITAEETELAKAVAGENRIVSFAAARRGPQALGMIIENSNKRKQRLEVLRAARFHTVTYTFNPKENRFDGMVKNTEVRPDPLSTEDFMKISLGLFSIIPMVTVDTVSPTHPPVKLLAEPGSIEP
jgi:hypothetical protein